MANTSDPSLLLQQLFRDDLNQKFKALIETKHLYQRVKLETDRSQVPHDKNSLWAESGVLDRFDAYISRPFQLLRSDEDVDVNARQPFIVLRNMKLFCPSCKCREAFAEIYHQDITRSHNPFAEVTVKLQAPLSDSLQIFCIAYQCQICKGDPITFIIRRTKTHLSIDGRSPIEGIAVAKYIPEEERGYMEASILSHQCGMTLAAILYLRVFIEQFARRVTRLEGRTTGDELLDAYSALLVETHRAAMPSLKSCYDRLSVAIHGGVDDLEMYQDVSNLVNKHFDLRRALGTTLPVGPKS
ncbi:hypothetical protein Terro_3681 [Terriglobus roseus DSM 18391]|uniref:DUF4145 domain-containing protein n=1 Tax=Terriglobus roseus (strain DSM 18391 / NRRL B-41598 / KBS 63) TaxID=926566 RepID=I3ZKX4_TERRK|nr:hypothetical protein [Terriglobus roseus]AFL89892.1 hypothetical protein Terro_3681 [Terriglobus roseus DSM 18391]